LLDTEQYHIKPGQTIKISKLDPDGESSSGVKKGESKDEIKKLTKKLDGLQEELYAEHKQKLLIILQGMDTGGKDGVIRHIFEGVNPSGVRVAHFREPSVNEMEHGFLWRVYKQIPADGEIVIFNRSHYEGVLVERVHSIVPKSVWEKRYGEINMFEKIVSDENVGIVKFFLYIDSAEQKRRIKERLDDPSKEWKFSEDDITERKYWNEYMKAYEDALNQTSTEYAPWYAVPSNHKWLRDLIVSTVVVEKLENFGMKLPKLPSKLREKAGEMV
jgi:PPK2 family polyphosphate:nucleotide phosphotransferase